MKLYKFRPLGTEGDLKKIEEIITKGFYCSDFLKFNDMNEGVFFKNPKNANISLKKKQKYKICSFSGEEALESQLMWGHYANAGMGVAIEIDKEDENIKKVCYCNITTSSNDIEKILTRKSKEWQYEYEFRYIKEYGDDIIFKDCFKKIYFGTPYEGLGNYENIKSKHKKLEKYFKLKKELKEYIEDFNEDFNKRQNINKICCKCWKFNF